MPSEKTKAGNNSGNGRHAFHPSYHYLVLVCCCIMAGVTVGFFNSAYGTFYTSLSLHFHTGRGQVTIHATISLIVTALTAPFSVKLAKKYGLRICLLFSLILQTASLLLILPATRIWQLNLLGVIRGIGGAFMHVPIITIILTNWYLDHVGMGMGITFSMASGFGAIFSWLISFMIQQVNYRFALVACSVILVLLSLPTLIFLRLRPEELHMHPHGWHPSDGSSVASSAAEWQEIRKSTPFYRIPDFYLLCAFGLLTVPVVAMQMHFSGFCEQIGAGSMFGGIMMSTVMFGSVIFKLVIGEILDLLGAFKMMASVLTVDILSLFIIYSNRSWSGNGTLLLIGAFLFGVHASIGSIGIAGVTRAVLGDRDDGTAFSIVSSCASTGAALSITVIAVLFDLTRSYDVSFLLGIGLLFSGCVILFILWKRKQAGVS